MSMFSAIISLFAAPYRNTVEFIDTRPHILDAKAHFASQRLDIHKDDQGRATGVVAFHKDTPEKSRSVLDLPVVNGNDAGNQLYAEAFIHGYCACQQEVVEIRRSVINVHREAAREARRQRREALVAKPDAEPAVPAVNGEIQVAAA